MTETDSGAEESSAPTSASLLERVHERFLAILKEASLPDDAIAGLTELIGENQLSHATRVLDLVRTTGKGTSEVTED